MVILSLSGNKDLSAKVRVWMEMWMWLMDNSQPMLIILFENAGDEALQIHADLRALAAGKRIDFITNLAPEDERAGQCKPQQQEYSWNQKICA
jgi:hypothetical protein